MKNDALTELAAKIYAAWEEKGRSESPRTYLGASIAGHECDMYLWLSHRGLCYQNFDGRMFRLFNRGKLEESVFVDELRAIGLTVLPCDDNGNQYSVSACGGHFGGHMDGVIWGLEPDKEEWRVVEFKTHSSASFKKLAKEGVRKAKPMHFTQMQVYMGLTGMKSALYMAVNKDDDSLYTEIVAFDENAYRATIERVSSIIKGSSADKCATRKDDFRCKGCACSNICWNTSSEIVEPCVLVSCRTCCHSTAVTEGEDRKWTCEIGGPGIKCGSCENHVFLPALVNAELVESDGVNVFYREGKTIFSNGPGGIASKDFKKLVHGSVESFMKMRVSFENATIIGTSSIRDKYSDETIYTKMFEGTREEFNGWIKAMPNFADLTKPLRNETFEGRQYVEYPYDVCIVKDLSTGNITVISDRSPF